MFFYSGTAYSDRTSNANATAFRVGNLYTYQSTKCYFLKVQHHVRN